MSTMVRPERALPQSTQRLLPIVVLAATLVVFLGTLQFEFVYDDLGQIVNNPLVHEWQYLPVYFQANVWAQSFVVGNYYRPIFMVWLLLNYTLFGLQPFFWHLTTVGLHLGATWLVFVLASRLTGDRVTGGIAALIFGVHPAHLEAVAWVSGLTEPLLAVLLIPSFLAYLNYREKGRNARWLAVSLLFYTAAMFAKETGVVLPALIVAWELIGSAEPASWRQRLVSSVRVAIPYALLTGGYLLARSNALHGLAHTLVHLPTSMLLLTVPSVVWFYLRVLIAPFHLSAFYDVPYVTHVSFRYFWWPLLQAAALLGVLAFWCWRARSRAIGFATVWLLVPLLPLLDLSVLPQGDFVHDRYLYLPSVGFAILMALALQKLKWGSREVLGQPASMVAATAALAIALATGTVIQSVPWANDLLLYHHGIEIAPNNDLPWNKLANALVTRGMYEDGIKVYQTVLASDPDFWFANFRMGFAQFKLGRYGEAEKYLGHALDINRNAEEFYYFGLTELELGKTDQAVQALSAAVRRSPQTPGYHYALGLALRKLGKTAEAMEAFKQELTLDPRNTGARQQVSELSREATH